MSYRIQIDDQIRDATSAESALIDFHREYEQARAVADQARKDAVASARTKLAALGLSEAEVAALLGG